MKSWRALLTKRIYADEAEVDLRSAWQLLTVREELASRPQNDRGVADEFSVITFLALFGVQIAWREKPKTLKQTLLVRIWMFSR